MSIPTKPSILSPTGAAVLHAAADRPDHIAISPENLPTAARNAVMASLLRAGMLEEVMPVGEGGVAVLRITPAGLAAIGREPADRGDESGPVMAEEGGGTQPVRLPLRGAAEAVLVAWDADEGREGLPGAVEALGAALARRGAGRGEPVRDPAAPPRSRGGTKGAAVLSLLRRPEGATIADVIAATGWQQHTVRGFLAGLKRKAIAVTVLDRVRQVGPGKAGAKGSYSIYRVAESTPASATVTAQAQR